MEKFLEYFNSKYNQDFNKLVLEYIPDSIQHIDEIKEEKYYVYLFFRYVYNYYVLISKYERFHPDNKLNIRNINEIKTFFLNWTRSQLKTDGLSQELLQEFDTHFEYLYDLIFVKNNIYISTYFNNIIPQLLPLPYEYLTYYPQTTYFKSKRSN